MPVKPRKKSVALVGHCSAEEAEDLQTWLLANPAGTINIAKCEDMHSAVVQVLMAAQRPVRGTPQDSSLFAMISGALEDGTATA